MEYLTLGRIIEPFGLDGTLKILSSSSFSNDRYKINSTLYLYNPKYKTRIPLTVTSYRSNNGIDYVKFSEINSKEEAITKRNHFIDIKLEEATLPNNYYHYYELEQCDIYDQNNTKLGHVKKVEEFPSQITLRVKRNNDKDFFVPFIDQFIKLVDIKEKKIIIEVIKGML